MEIQNNKISKNKINLIYLMIAKAKKKLFKSVIYPQLINYNMIYKKKKNSL